MQTYSQPTSASTLPKQLARVDPRPVVVLAVDKSDVDGYPSTVPTALAHTTAEAIDCIDRTRPRVVAVDWDLTAIDGAEVCRAAAKFSTMVLAITGTPQRVPSALKAGCHAILLKPFTLNLAAARLGRLCREAALATSPPVRAIGDCGTNRTWPDTLCPQCATRGATSFDNSSYRRMWYACLRCEHVWLGARQE